jgi:hypothetical protein
MLEIPQLFVFETERKQPQRQSILDTDVLPSEEV